MIKIRDGIVIREDSLIFKFSRSGGPGGQNVNKVNTRVTVFFDVAGSESFSEVQKKRILEKLKGRANKDGVLRVVSSKYRTQGQNRSAVVERLAELLKEALVKKVSRKKTAVPYRTKIKRLEQKKHRGDLKKQRSQRFFSDD